jgi:hypothetical protein
MLMIDSSIQSLAEFSNIADFPTLQIFRERPAIASSSSDD